MSTFSLLRYDMGWDDKGFIPDDEVAIVIDGQDLSDLLAAAGEDAGAGLIPYVFVAPPSRHWLGQPAPGLVDRSRQHVVVLEGGCGVWECCGVTARMSFEDTTVTWWIGGIGKLTFDRSQYEAAIRGLPEMASLPFRYPADEEPDD